MRTINILLLCINKIGNTVKLKDNKFSVVLDKYNFILTYDGNRYRFFMSIDESVNHLIDLVLYITEKDGYFKIKEQVNRLVSSKSLVISNQIPGNKRILNESVLLHLNLAGQPNILLRHIRNTIARNDNDFKRVRQIIPNGHFTLLENRMKFSMKNNNDCDFSDRLRYKLNRQRRPFIGPSGLMDILRTEKIVEPVGRFLIIASKGLKAFLHTARQTNHRTHAGRFSITLK